MLRADLGGDIGLDRGDLFERHRARDGDFEIADHLRAGGPQPHRLRP